MKFRLVITNLFWLTICLLLLGRSNLSPGDQVEKIRVYTRMIEFDYVNWTLDALFTKGAQTAVSISRYQSEAQQKQTVLNYLDLVKQINEVQSNIQQIYSNPQETNPAVTAQPWLDKLKVLQNTRQRLGPLCESILQEQISTTLAGLDLGLGGQPVPPVLYRVTPLPLALIVSPRTVIREDADISLLPGMRLDEIVALETRVEKNLNVSALVEEVGGIGVYPTMVMSSTDLPWLLEVVSHEWTHNFLTLRPLGINYDTSPELRTMNETTADISGKEIANAVLARYYPEYLPKPQPTPQTPQEKPTETPPANTPPPFSFNKEMRITRVTSDQLLAEGKVDEAESYMEERRIFFWDNGYQIRRLNQAYFAFHGAYAESAEGGAAGSDPVGPTVQLLRQHSSSLADFLNHISWIDSFDKLQKVVEAYH